MKNRPLKKSMDKIHIQKILGEIKIIDADRKLLKEPKFNPFDNSRDMDILTNTIEGLGFEVNQYLNLVLEEL